MDPTDQIYLDRVSHNLDKFERRADGKFHFRCPYCGDSRSNPNKKTAAIFSDGDVTIFKCLRCETTKPFGPFLRDVDPSVHAYWSTEKWREKHSSRSFVEDKLEPYDGPQLKTLSEFFGELKSDPAKSTSVGAFSSLPRCDKLSPRHPARIYLEKRSFPLDRAFWTDDFIEWAAPHGYTTKSRSIEGRVLFPIIVRGLEVGAQARNIDNNSPRLRYITITWNKNVLPVIGLDTLLLDRDIYVVEGVFDAYATTNGIAALRSDLVGVAEEYDLPKDKTIIVCDNEPGSPLIVKQLKRAIDGGWNVGIWRDRQSIIGKDLSEAMSRGFSIEDCIDVKRGLSAMLEIARWKNAVF